MLYGYKLVSATFVEEQDDDYFTNQSDRTALGLLETIKTAVLDVESGQWGVAVLNLQANIPNTLPGQAVRFVLLGDVEVENAVAPEDAFTPADPIAITTLQPANVRSGPGLNYNVIGSVGSGVEFQADGFSEDGAWLRIVFGSVPAWIFGELVESEESLEGLPTLSPDVRMPMQAFYLRTGIGEAECVEAPADSLMVQGPEDITVDLTVNGANVTLGSTVLFRIIPPGDKMEITVIDGHAVIDGVTVFPGWKTTVCLSDPGNRGVDGESNDRIVSCDPSDPVPIDQDDVAGWCLLGEMPASPINYPVPIDCVNGVANPYVPPPVVDPNIGPGGVDCSALAIGDPTQGMQAVSNTFWWNGVEAATEYKIVLYNEAGNVMGNHSVPAPTTWKDLGGFVQNTSFRWDLEAYRDGELLCSTGTGWISISPPQQHVSTLSANWQCDWPSGGAVKVSWSGALPSDTLHVEVKDVMGTVFSETVSGASGSVVIPVDWYQIVFGDIEGSPSGDLVTFSGTLFCTPS